MNFSNPNQLQKNIELKARLGSLQTARKQAELIATDTAAPQFQVDTYFNSPHGRLKLREINGEQAQLIWYERPQELQPKTSNYLIQEVVDVVSWKQLLDRACGICATVRKHREIFFYENVRIHLDNVDSLGAFLEFEAVLSKEGDEQRGHSQLRLLTKHFQITSNDLLKSSYGEQILQQAVSSVDPTD